MRITIFGAGTWGTALAALLSRTGHELTLWSALPEELDAIARTHRHPHLADTPLPEDIRTEADAAVAAQDAEVAIVATPSAFVRATARRIAPHLPSGIPVASAAKGIEDGTYLTMTDILSEELAAARAGEHFPTVALSGPTHAEEVAAGVPTSMVAACEDETVARQLAALFVGSCMRVYTNTDVRGVEIAGAVKNVIALAAGMHRGMGFGDNTLAMLLTRGIAEITRLGVACGCRRETFMGLSGIGDLIVTCTSRHSRNNRCGELIGRGYTYAQAAEEIGMVVEGYHALGATLSLAREKGVEMPITEAVAAVLHGKSTAREATEQLMRRTFKSETE